MKRVEKYLSYAIQAITQSGIAENNKVASEYNGYIASFGASVISSGLLSAVAFYSSTKSNSEQDRKRLMDAILIILKRENNGYTQNELFDLVQPDPDNKLLRRKILDAATAIKLGIRTFVLEKRKGDLND